MKSPPPKDADPGVLLIEGWMLGAIFFPEAMAETVRVPPANDRVTQD